MEIGSQREIGFEILSQCGNAQKTRPVNNFPVLVHVEGSAGEVEVLLHAMSIAVRFAVI